ncbi:MAG: arginine--tRNA ligase [Limisphaerales bacterium]
MLHLTLQERLRAAFGKAFADVDPGTVTVRPCSDARFGDYQCVSIMPLAKQLKTKPRQIATSVLEQLETDDLCEKVEVAGPGFINFHVKTAAIEAVLKAAADGEHNFYSQSVDPRTIVIDFSSPNVAKPMHVGHIRSTILGDCLARLFRLLGHRVVTDNHIGDWGTQFGMLLFGWKNELNQADLETDPIAELERTYKLVNVRCKKDEEVLEACRQELVKLQGGDEENLGIWHRMIELSQTQFDAIYSRLDIKFDETLGESFYNEQLPGIVEELVGNGLASESQGAMCVFSGKKMAEKVDPFLVHRDGEWQDNPALIRKKDGGFNYTTTDLATLQHRLTTWNPAEVLYVTDGRQQLHFRQLFDVFGRWHPEAEMKLAHVWFGSILGDDGKPFKTRSGDTVKLADLLNEAEERALAIVDEKNPDLPADQKNEIARIVGIGAVKYADLLPNRQSDYVFSWDKMLSLQGNTAVYLLYAYTRVRSIFRKAAGKGFSTEIRSDALNLEAESEIALAKKLMEFGVVLEQVGEDYRPNLLCNYLFETAGCYSQFFENCQVVQDDEAVRNSRMVLCELTARVLKAGLGVLGIETTEVM